MNNTSVVHLYAEDSPSPRDWLRWRLTDEWKAYYLKRSVSRSRAWQLARVKANKLRAVPVAKI